MKYYIPCILNHLFRTPNRLRKNQKNYQLLAHYSPLSFASLVQNLNIVYYIFVLLRSPLRVLQKFSPSLRLFDKGCFRIRMRALKIL